MGEIDRIAKSDCWPPVNDKDAPKKMETIEDVVSYLIWSRNMTSSFICMMKSSDVRYVLTLKASDIDKYFSNITHYGDRPPLSKKAEAEEALKKYRTENKLGMPKIDLIELIYVGDHDQIKEAIKKSKAGAKLDDFRKTV